MKAHLKPAMSLFLVFVPASDVSAQAPATQAGDRLTVTLNEKLVIDAAQLPGVPRRGPMALQLHSERKDGEWGASLVQFRNIRIKELTGEN